MNQLALIVAGGTGSRMKESVPKQVLPLNGVPIIVHTIRRFLEVNQSLFIGLVLHPAVLEEWKVMKNEWFSAEENQRMIAVTGGATRTQSVHNGLKALHNLCQSASISNPLIAVHDAVRPFVSVSLIQKAYDIASEKGSAVVAVPVKSSMRKRLPNGSIAIDRSEYFHVQTPQVFQLDQLITCYENAGEGQFTDDASLVEAQGINIHLCEGSYDNIKITSPEDMIIAERILAKSKAL